MSFPSWPELAEELRGVERPARYLGSEPGANPGVWPDENGFILRIALAFPEVYEIAHSHLGHKILYHLFNGQRGFSAERAYAPWPDYEKRLGPNRPLRSLESRAPLSDFHVVGFSLQYELSYTNILNMLALGGLNPLAAERPEGAPLVVAGGPGAANPEPLADFFDLFFLGEAEDSWLGDFAVIKDWARAKAPKAELFARLAGRPGVYLPALYEPQYEKGRFIGVRPLGPAGPSVPPAKVASLSRAPFPLCQIVPWVKPVHDRVVVEIARGCARGCRFCQAGYLYRPVRERGAQEILDLTEKNLLATGYDEAAFLSLSAGDHSQIEPLVASFMNRWANSKVALSLPSLRVKSLSRELASQISRTRKTGFTIAPEAATARLRAVINKDLSEDDLFAACETAFSLGWRTIKLYFMSGLPTETDEDLWAMGDLAGRLKKLSKAQINLSVATFVPKAHTPFQWQKASSEEDCSRRLKALSNLAKKPGLAFRYGSAEASLIEAVLARGDRRLGRVVQAVWGLGARFEAWNENLKASYWKEALSRQGFAVPELLAAKDPHGPLPWGHLGPFVSQDFLLRELAKAGRAEVTLDCRQGGCQGCGACQAVPMSLAAAGPTGPALAVSPGQALAADPSQTLSPANPWAPSDLNLDQKSQSSAPPPRATGPKDQSQDLSPRPQAAEPGTLGQEASHERPIRQGISPNDSHKVSPGPPEGLSGPGDPGQPQELGALKRGDLKGHPDGGQGHGPIDGPVGLSGGLREPIGDRGGPKATGRPAKSGPQRPAQAEVGCRILFEYQKTGPMSLLGHLEMVEVFKRAFRRANLKVAYSQGFHPQPRLSFLTALPLGLESDQEIMVATLEEYLAPAAAQGRLRLPEGLAVKRARILPPGGPKPKVASISYQIVSDTDLFIGKPLHPAALLRYTDNKGRLREYSLASFVESISAPTPRRLLLALKLGESGSPKPLAAVQALYGLTEAATLTIRKLATNLA